MIPNVYTILESVKEMFDVNLREPLHMPLFYYEVAKRNHFQILVVKNH